MITRICNPLESRSFFLFGARGTGKTTFIQHHLRKFRVLRFDLLRPEVEHELSVHLTRFREQVLQSHKTSDWVVLDEVQRLPRLLNEVHSLIESHKIKFAITGSSARKLRRGQANLLAGRALLNHLHPLTAYELGSAFDLNATLSFGGLPALSQMTTHIEKQEFLKSYVGTYIQEEIKSEQVVRQLDPFRRFLAVAAQMNSKIINYSAIHRDVGADVKTIQNYYQILEDTMMGFFLEPFHSSVRKVLSQKPKFYFFDIGVQRAIAGLLEQKPVEGSSYFGELFESFFILECLRLNDYLRKDYQFYFLKTKDDVEIDLIVKRPNKPFALVEVKSAKEVREDHLRHFRKLGKDFKNAECFCACREKLPRRVDNVLVAPWEEILRIIFEF